MTPTFSKLHGGTIVMSLIAGVIILVTAWQTKGTSHQDAWLYVFFIWIILFAAFEMYYSYKNKKSKGTS